MDNNDYEEDNQTGDFNEEEEVFENAKEIAVENKADVKEKVGSQPKQPGTKQKRRSKNDCIGRDYVCGCGKTYLSYPALYTHIKTKHNGKTPEGTNANQVQTGNGNSRGRPRKNFLTNEDSKSRRNRDNNRKEMTLDERNNELRELLNKKNNNVDSIRENENCYFEIYRSFDVLKKEKEKEIMKGHSSKGNENYNEFSEDFNENNEMSVDSEEEEKKEQNNEAQNANKKQEAEDKEENYNVLDAFPTINIEQGINTSYLQLYSQVKLLLNDPAKNQHISKKNEEAKVVTCDEAFGMFLTPWMRKRRAATCLSASATACPAPTRKTRGLTRASSPASSSIWMTL